MRVIAIWLLCSVPLILTVIDAVKAASRSVTGDIPDADSGTEQPGEYSSLQAIDPELLNKVKDFAWFDMPSAGDDGIPAAFDAAPEIRQLQTASAALLTINRGLRKIVKGFENPQVREADLRKFADGGVGVDGEINKLGELPVGESLRRCVAAFLDQREVENETLKLRATALENYRKAQKDNDAVVLDKLIIALNGLAKDQLTDDDREQLRWAKFWKFWLQAKSSRPITDKASMEARKEVLETLVLQGDDPDFLPVKGDEVKLVENCRKEIEILTSQIKFEPIKEQVRDGSPQSWLADAESLLDQLNNADARQLRKLIRDTMLSRVATGVKPNAPFEEAITKSGNLWMGTFELKGNADDKSPRYVFVPTSGKSNKKEHEYAYLSKFAELRREPFALNAYTRLCAARDVLKISPQSRESWESLRTVVSTLLQEKDKYLKLNMIDGEADRKKVMSSLEPLKLEEMQAVCDEILSEAMWPRMEKLLSNKP